MIDPVRIGLMKGASEDGNAATAQDLSHSAS